LRPPPTSPLFPYTTLFRSGISVPTHYLNPDARFRLVPITMNCTVPPIPRPERAYWVGVLLREVIRAYPAPLRVAVVATGGLSHRSEEHTSELQSRFDLVCR